MSFDQRGRAIGPRIAGVPYGGIERIRAGFARRLAKALSGDGTTPPRWAVVAAALVPILTISAWLLADAAQSGNYSPVQQSVSVLAGRAGADRWIVTWALLLVGGAYLVAAAGLNALNRAARGGLVVAGVSAVGIASFPEPHHGSTPAHLAFTCVGAVAITVWPALAASRESTRGPRSVRASVIACAVFGALLLWTLAETQHGRALGLAERLSSSTQVCWPFLVVSSMRRQARARRVAVARIEAVPGERNGYADLLRTVAIGAVVLGHWLATGVERRDGRFVGVDALGVVTWGSWVTLVLQVVPVFFLVGGFANGASWRRHEAQGETATSWIRARVLRLLVPTCAYSAVIVVAVLACQLFGLNPLTLAQAAWGVALHLWFLAVYAVVLLCTPILYAAHRRWGLLVPVAMAALAVVLDVGVVELRWPVIGWANYLLVWGTFHQLGFAWQDGSLTTRRRPALLAGGSALALVGLIWIGPYPVSMVGVPGARIQNASPPSTALLAFGLAQAGIVLLCEPAGRRWLARHRRARSTIATAGRLTMPVYLWHMVPVVILIGAGYPRLFGLPAVGSRHWWEQRLDWLLALGLVLAALLALLAGLTRLTRRHHPAEPSGRAIAPARVPSPRSAVALLVSGVAVAAFGIAILAINGFAPHGHLAVMPLLAIAFSVVLVRSATGTSGAR
jgi:fucose 4-O-acetylase-like acetyltransferase